MPPKTPKFDQTKMRSSRSSSKNIRAWRPWNAASSPAHKLWLKYKTSVAITPEQEHDCGLAYHAGMMDCLAYTLELSEAAPEPVAGAMLARLRRDITQSALRVPTHLALAVMFLCLN